MAPVRKVRRADAIKVHPEIVAECGVEAGYVFGLLEKHDGENLTQAAMASQMGVTRQAVSRYMRKLVEAGWIEIRQDEGQIAVYCLTTQRRASKPSDSPPKKPSSPTRNRYPERFDVFWKSYPMTNGTKWQAYQAWRRLSPLDQAAALSGLHKWRTSSHWRQGYVIYAERYLKRRMWEDDPAPEPTTGNGHHPNGNTSESSTPEQQTLLEQLWEQGAAKRKLRPELAQKFGLDA